MTAPAGRWRHKPGEVAMTRPLPLSTTLSGPTIGAPSATELEAPRRSELKAGGDVRDLDLAGRSIAGASPCLRRESRVWRHVLIVGRDEARSVRHLISAPRPADRHGRENVAAHIRRRGRHRSGRGGRIRHRHVQDELTAPSIASCTPSSSMESRRTACGLPVGPRSCRRVSVMFCRRSARSWKP